MDKIDKKIIKMLAENADITSTEISEELHFSIPTVNKRIRDLKKDGVIQKYMELHNCMLIFTNGLKHKEVQFQTQKLKLMFLIMME